MAPNNNTSLHIPVELTDMIIDFLHDDVQSLLACAVVSHSWLPSSRLHLFRSCTIKDPSQFEVAFRTIVTTQDVSIHILELTIVGERIHCFTLKILKALLGDLPQLRRLSLQKVQFQASWPTGRRFAQRFKYDIGEGIPTYAMLELEVPQWPQRIKPFELEELQLLECDATMANYTHLFRILGLFSSIQTLFLASSSTARDSYSHSARRIPDWALDPVRVAVQHLHTFDIPFPIIETLLKTLGPANALRTFWYDDNVLDWTGAGGPSTNVQGFGRMAASLPAHQQLRTLVLGPLPIFQADLRGNLRDGLGDMQLASMRGLETFHLRGHRLEPHLASVFAALPESVREARFVVVGVSRAHGEGFWNRFYDFAQAFACELARRRRMTFVLDLGVVKQKLSGEKFAALRMAAAIGLRSLRSGAPGRVRIGDSPEAS
ncbi:hypothetical protein GSI_03224 [Ganoderma sinense ZZ0214-1]|uniref:F-box domain-containing protein n=1 Tax=Ganoderma sinense ZZ0214-1 TaxID=1077348 RepID=A0A2G8SLJ4_9APHY|nr:hypothetical protein GSI_03224 [Ganoderma sinense ZZ0214-1]